MNKKKYEVNPTVAVAIDCRYNKRADIEKVLQGQAINLVDALKNGKIPPIELPDSENGLTSPDDVTGRCQDAFDAAEVVRNSYGRREQHEANKAAKASAAASPAAAAAAAVAAAASAASGASA